MKNLFFAFLAMTFIISCGDDLPPPPDEDYKCVMARVRIDMSNFKDMAVGNSNGLCDGTIYGFNDSITDIDIYRLCGPYVCLPHYKMIFFLADTIKAPPEYQVFDKGHYKFISRHATDTPKAMIPDLEQEYLDTVRARQERHGGLNMRRIEVPQKLKGCADCWERVDDPQKQKQLEGLFQREQKYSTSKTGKPLRKSSIK